MIKLHGYDVTNSKPIKVQACKKWLTYILYSRK